MNSAGMNSAGPNHGQRLAVAIAVALGLVSQAHAMGLGTIEVKSQLGKPFVAEIPITLSLPNEADDLSVRLASPEAFERVGLERPNDLSANLTFTIGKNARGEPVIRISTPQPMTDPYVSFLLEADWGRGKMVREYTALLDPPRTTAVRRVPIVSAVVQSTPMPTSVTPAVVAPSTATPATTPSSPGPVASTTVQPGQPAPGSILEAPAAAPPGPMVATPEPPAPIAAEPEPVAPAVPESAPAAPAPEPEVAAAALSAAPDAYTVAPGDTLAHIASGLHAEVSLNRMMIALQRANPDAFIHQNINLLKSGSVLRIPAAQEAQTLSADEANLLVQQQVESWRQTVRPSTQPSTESAEIPSPAEKIIQASAPQEPAAEPVKPAAAPRVAKARHTIAKTTAAAKPGATESAVEKPAPKAVVSHVSKAHLEIVPPAGGGALSSQTGASAGGSGSELRAQLAQTKEDLAARNSEVGELKSRVAELEKLQQDNQSLLSMKDSKLAEMQQRLAELEKNSATPPTGTNAAAPDATAAAPTTTPGTETPSTATATPATAATITPPPVSAVTPDVAPKTAPAPASEQPAEAAETPWYQRPLVLIGAGLLLLGGMLGLLLRGRRAPEEVVRPSRYNTDALAASMASARAAADEDAATGDDDLDREAEHFEARDEPATPPVAAPGMPLPSTASSPVRRPYWTGAYEAESKPGDAEPRAVEPVEPVSALPPAVAKAPAPEQDDWGLDKQPASATAITARHRAVPALDDMDQGAATKMELARAYIDIGDTEGARGMLEEVLMEGTDDQREDALKLLDTLE